jgi:hypothetical protein
MPWECEYTDTFGGEANYSWVRRETVEVPDRLYMPSATPRHLGTRFKRALGLTNVRGRTYWQGDSWEFRPYKTATVAFARWVDDDTPL